jgi:hypothetical protein
VHEGAVGIINILRNDMSWFQIIVPKQNQCADELLSLSRGLALLKSGLKLSLQNVFWLDTLAGARTQFRRFRSREKF